MKNSLRLGVGVVLVAMFSLLGAGASSAVSAAPTGLVRLAHLSPDTPSVDIAVSGTSNGTKFRISDVAYGTVSGFMEVPVGTYTADMAVSGANVLTTPITVEAGKPLTVAAVGKSGSLKAITLSDDFTQPSNGNSRVRLIQGSVNADSVSVDVDGNQQLVKDAAFGTATDYAEVPSRTWTVSATPNGGTAKAGNDQVTLPANSVVTLLVLDNPDGTLAVRTVVDSAGTPTPMGGVETGGGGLATNGGGGALWFAVGAISMGLVGGLVISRKHNGRHRA